MRERIFRSLSPLLSPVSIHTRMNLNNEHLFDQKIVQCLIYAKNSAVGWPTSIAMLENNSIMLSLISRSHIYAQTWAESERINGMTEISTSWRVKLSRLSFFFFYISFFFQDRRWVEESGNAIQDQNSALKTTDAVNRYSIPSVVRNTSRLVMLKTEVSRFASDAFCSFERISTFWGIRKIVKSWATADVSPVWHTNCFVLINGWGVKLQLFSSLVCDVLLCKNIKINFKLGII